MGLLTSMAGGGDDSGLGGQLLKSLKKKRKQETKPSDQTSGDVQDSYHKGGRVRRTGPARLKKGEQVLTKKQAKRYRKTRGK